MRRRHPVPRQLGGIALALLLSAGSLPAQEGAAVAAGARVRVHSDVLRPPVLVGTVRSLTPDTLVLRHPDVAGDLRLPRASITHLEVSEGTPGRGRRAVLGAAIGLFLGVFVGSGLEGGGCDDCSRRENELSRRSGSILLGSLGAFAGLLIGAATARERWAPADTAPIAPAR